MGSLKDETRGFGKENGECADADPMLEGPLMSTSQESTGRGGDHIELLHDVSSGNDGQKYVKKPEDAKSGKVCDNSLRSDFISMKDREQIEAVRLEQQPESDRTTAVDGSPDYEGVATQDMDNVPEDKVLFSLPSTGDPCDPNSPAPFGQHHMRTQVSLEVVQCHSAATSPMTPPEGAHSFIFPNSFRRSEADAQMQVGQQVEFCSVATSPMTPETPSTTAFPALAGRDVSGTQKITPTTKSPAEAESDAIIKSSTETAACSPESRVEDGNQQCKQKRMGSMDQDITILVTQYDNDKMEERECQESSFHPLEITKTENEERDNKDFKREENASTKAADPYQESNAKSTQSKMQTSKTSVCTNQTPLKPDIQHVRREEKEMSKPPVPESPAPDGCHNIRTQVSLEVVQCQSAATSPMTPPEGDHAFHFPSDCERTVARTTDAEIQVGQQVQHRSTATAPMTPRTPTVTTFPEIGKEASTVKKNDEDEEDQKADQASQVKVEEKKEVTVENVVEEAEEENDCKEKSEEVVQEVSWDEKGMTWEVYGAVVEVAVLGSAIQKHLEKQVKKQKRQPTLPPPPPLNPSATPLAYDTARGGSSRCRAAKTSERDVNVGRNRRNPFRLLMENMQQPHCCSRAHTTE
ncbi:G protein-regulated inducer of neurite outgrowth 1 [Hippocampus zosterae]|uniref:G protein-regulated inducer of neurite outgrowth 1 n=1 Tax=Hippocampus zosterae TaxID=109293 RepID=UPI00223E4BDE|nr:G protein-regulated inducer of neurite outgrowth 1 [Hippocampus zosterae]